MDHVPDPSLVERAIAALPEWTGEEPLRAWKVERMVHFPSSVIHFISLPESERHTRLVYKTRRRQTDAGWFANNPPRVNKAVRLLREAGLRGAPVLAFDVRNRVLVTLYVKGKPYGQLKWFDWRLSERERETLVTIGRGASILETVSEPTADWNAQERLLTEFSERLSRADISSALRESAKRVAMVSFQAAMADRHPFVMVNHDLNPGNVVVEEDVPGFIDLSFGLGLRATGLAKLVHSLQFNVQLPSPSLRTATLALQEGYGAEPPGMNFLRVYRILRMLGPSHDVRQSMSLRRQRALRGLRRLIESDFGLVP